MKLAVFSGQYFWFDGKHYSTDEAFVKFVTSFHPYFEKIIFCDALKEERKTKAYVLDPIKTEVCPLPYFSVYSFWKNILVIYPKIYRVIRDNIQDWDIIWLHAPHPVSLIFAYICRSIHKPFFLFIRQNLKTYVRCRNRGARRLLAVFVATTLEYAFRSLARNTLTFTVGQEIYDIYRKGGEAVYQTTVSLVSDKDIDESTWIHKAKKSGQMELLNVGRIDPEKGLTYLIQAIDELVADGMGNIKLHLVGEGTEERRLRREVSERGLNSYVHFTGYLKHNGHLFNLYKKYDIFVLPSLTEGLPQAIFEAMACGVPIIATKVGGIPYIIKDGENALLINPHSSTEICTAVERLISDLTLRYRLISNGLSTVKRHTLEAERDRIMCRIQELLEHSQF